MNATSLRAGGTEFYLPPFDPLFVTLGLVNVNIISVMCASQTASLDEQADQVLSTSSA
jgi:hypothetical protein